MDKLGALRSIGGVVTWSTLNSRLYRMDTVTERLPTVVTAWTLIWKRLSTCIPMLFCFLRLRIAAVTDALKNWIFLSSRMCRLYGDFRFGACRMDAFLRVAFWCCFKKPTAFLPRWIVVITSLENVLHFSSSSLSIVSELKSGSAWYVPRGSRYNRAFV